MENGKKILFSIDLEEFDIPEEFGLPVTLNQKLQVSFRGMKRLQALMESLDISSTIFTTAFWATQFPAYVQELSAHHEIASHTFYHNRFEVQDLTASRERLQDITGKTVTGLRMPRMQQVNHQIIRDAGYDYDSSMHPTWLPGRYNHFRKERRIHKADGLWHMPVSVTPVLRIPVFWLGFKNFHPIVYKQLIKRILDHDGYLVFYVHPWEFTDLSGVPLPGYVKRLHGDQLLFRLRSLLTDLKAQASFVTHGDFIQMEDRQPVVLPTVI